MKLQPDKNLLNPFFIRKISFLPGYYIWIPLILGVSFLLPYILVSGDSGISKSSGILTLVIIFAYLFLYVAISTFNNLFPKVKALCNKSHDLDELKHKYLNDRQFNFFGLIFAFLNCLIGFLLCPQDTGLYSNLVLGWGYFIAGYFCGLAVGGIYGLISFFNDILDRPLKLDYTHPDQKGGTRFLGTAFMIFSGVTITEGVLIALYLITENWSGSLVIAGQTDIIDLIEWFWIFWPFILGLLVLFIPSLKLNQILINYKDIEERGINAKLEELRNKILEPTDNADKLEMNKALYNYHEECRKKLFQMNSWPFSVTSLFNYCSLFLGNIIVTYESGQEFFDKFT